MKIKLLVERQDGVNGLKKPGDIIDIADGEGKRLIKLKKATLVKEKGGQENV